jgi:hypothetical protein
MAIGEIEVQMSSEHIDRNASVSPKEAIKELIWNACDADATIISVKLNKNYTAGESIEEVIVIDNGHGLNYEDIEAVLGYYGRSNKIYSTKSPNGRLYHGRQGHGRYKSLSIGLYIKWESVYKAADGKTYKFNLNFDSNSKTKISYSEKVLVPDENKAGMTITITGIMDTLPGLLDVDKMRDEIVSSFAAYLIAYPDIKIYYDSYRINPEDFIQESEVYDIAFELGNENDKKAKSTIILWKSGFGKEANKLFICGENGVAYDVEALNLKKTKNHSISVYLLSSVFDELHRNNLLSASNINEDYTHFTSEARRLARDFINNRFYTEAVEEVKNIKDSDIYPYKDESGSSVENVERQCFDLLSVEVNNIIPSLRNASNETKKLTYRLIKETVKTNPDSLTAILIEVFNLSQEEQDKLAVLLKHTTLPSIINTAQTISNRLLFIHALEQMVYNTTVGKAIRERTQFHKILLSELWIFGEKYTLGTSDISLKNVLNEYKSHLERESLVPNIPQEAALDVNLIPDLCLWGQYPIQDDRIENLVIELKRPTKILQKKELDQIEGYAFAVAGDNRFPKENTRWNFLLLGGDFNSYVSQKLRDRKDGDGNFYNSDDGSISISVIKWNKIIQENKLKLNFLRNKLNYSLEDSQPALDYLYATYKALFEANK